MSTKHSLSPTTSPPHKTARAPPPPDTDKPFVCTLPPTCNKGAGTPLAGARELESHYAKYHAHVCAVPGCECVFPDARLLELHLTECHDPLAAVRKERGDKIFACHLASCTMCFRTPKNRRLHLIQAHGYPKEYFFAVTNKGVGGLLRRWGEGASLVRGTWKPRDAANGGGGRDHVDENSDDEDRDEDGMDEDEHEADKQSRKPYTPAKNTAPRAASVSSPPGAQKPVAASADVDALANNMSALSLVPASVRFGRGARSSGHTGRHAHVPPPQSSDPPNPASGPDTEGDSNGQDATPAQNPYLRGRGLGGRGRGRGGGAPFAFRGGGPPPGRGGAHRGAMARGMRGRGLHMA